MKRNSRSVFPDCAGNEATDESLLKETAQKIIDITAKYCGGRGHIVIPEVI